MKATEHILLVDDNEDDAFLMKRSLQRRGFKNPVDILGEPRNMLDYLHGRREYWDRALYPLPALIVLSIDLASGLGPALLRQLRCSDGISHLPVIAVGNSARNVDIQKAFDLGANAYFAKDIDLNGLADTLKHLQLIDRVENEVYGETDFEGEEESRDFSQRHSEMPDRDQRSG